MYHALHVMYKPGKSYYVVDTLSKAPGVLARDVLYWPGMNDQIANLIRRCDTCQTYRSCQQTEPMKNNKRTYSERSTMVALDLLNLMNESYFVLTNYFSKFFKARKLTSITSAAIIKHLKLHFARYGIPEEIISDNGTQLSSGQFANSAKTYHFKHKYYSDYFFKIL